MLTDKELLGIAREFRKGMLGRRESKDWCYAISAPLVGYLEFCGFHCELVEGYIGNIEHYWLAFLDGRILDPTADQFDGNMPGVYLGVKPNNYEVQETGIKEVCL